MTGEFAREMVIAIDGPSGVGKSTTAQRIAAELGWLYLNTGSMYRAVTLAWLQAGAEPDRFRDVAWLKQLEIDFDQAGSIRLAGQAVAEEVRSARVAAEVSMVSADPEVRRISTEQQRRIGLSRPSILDGRDIGTVVFPDAFLKIFLVASEKVRAHRRWLQLGGTQSGSTDHGRHRDPL